MDSLFERLRPETLLRGEWATVLDEPGLTLARKNIGPDVSLLRAEYEIKLSFADAYALIRPEVYFDERRPDFDITLLECGVERVYAPGDAMCFYRPMLSSKSATIGIARAAIVGSAKVSASGMQAGDALRVRWVNRRSFPSPDQCSFLIAPVVDESGALGEQDGVSLAMVSCFGRHPDDPEGRTRVTELRMLRRVADWSLEHTAGYYRQKEQWIERYKASSVYQAVRSGATKYVAVGISKLTRGPPLLPKDNANHWGWVEGKRFDADWEHVCSSNSFAWFLQTFLHRIGINVEVYPTVDGQRLVYFQAALLREDWDRASTALDSGPWRAHNAAYRAKYGGKHAPKLSVSEPRFCDHPLPGAAQVAPAMTDEVESVKSEPCRIPVLATFIHFGKHVSGEALPTLIRGNSDPELLSLIRGNNEPEFVSLI